jgi:outer membrane protein insertion porin family
MIRRDLIASIFFVLLVQALSSPVFGALEDYEVSWIRLAGNETFSDGTLREQMSLKGYSWIQKFFLGKDASRFSSEILTGDLARLRRFYQRRGFLYVKIDRDELAVDNDGRQVGIPIRISEGSPITVDSVTFKLTSPMPTDSVRADSLLEGLRSDLRLRRLIRFQDQLVTEDNDRIAHLLADNGYPYADVVPELDVDTVANLVRVAWKIATGPLCRIGAITVTGNDRVADDLVLRQLTTATGAIYRQKDLNESQRRLIELAVFEVATVTGVLGKDRGSEVPIRITLREAPRLNAKVGVGYGEEDEVRVFTESRLLGFLGGARRLELFVKHSGLEPYHVRLRWVQPAFLDPQTSATLSPFVRRQVEPGFILNRYGGSAGLDHRFSPALHASGEYIFERINLDTLSVATEGTAPADLEELYNKSSVALGLTFDKSEPAFSPNRGGFAGLTFKLSGLSLGSKYHFTRILADVRHYHSILGVVVAARVKGGSIGSFDAGEFVPVEDRFFAGGSSSVRGWARGELGPIADGTPAGGKSYMEGSLELRFPIIGILSGAVFSDAGNVWRDTFEYNLDGIRYAAGLGLRFRTPIGPVRIDLARPVFDDVTAYQLHLNVGEAF